jgi:hypothetical protein
MTSKKRRPPGPGFGPRDTEVPGVSRTAGRPPLADLLEDHGGCVMYDRTEADRRYNASEKGRERHHRYNTSEKGRKRSLDYNWSDKGQSRDYRRYKRTLADRIIHKQGRIAELEAYLKQYGIYL